MWFNLLIVATSLFGSGYSQCKRFKFSTSDSSYTGIDICRGSYNSSGALVGSYKYTCDAQGNVMSNSYMGVGDCSNTPQTGTVTGAVSVTCTGVVCGATRTYYSTSACDGTPLYSDEQFADGTCQWNSAQGCAGTTLTEYYYGSEQQGCPNNQSARFRSISTTTVGAVSPCSTIRYCTNSSCVAYSRIVHFKYTACSAPATTSFNFPPLTFQGDTLTLSQYPASDMSCTGATEAQTQQSLDTNCQAQGSGSGAYKQFCDARAYWFYQYNTSDCSTIDQALYLPRGCSASGINLFSGGLSNVSRFSLQCASSVGPATINFGSPYALVGVYADANCNHFVYGGYLRADGTCSMGSLSYETFRCIDANTSVTQIYGAAGCTGPSIFNQTFSVNTCTKIPNSDINGNPVYGKLQSCSVSSTGVIDPQTSPGLPGLNGAKKMSVSLVLILVGVVCGVNVLL